MRCVKILGKSRKLRYVCSQQESRSMTALTPSHSCPESGSGRHCPGSPRSFPEAAVTVMAGLSHPRGSAADNGGGHRQPEKGLVFNRLRGKRGNWRRTLLHDHLGGPAMTSYTLARQDAFFSIVPRQSLEKAQNGNGQAL